MTLAFDHPAGIALLVVSGLIAGFVNTVAGGGSLLTLPALMILGMPADVANGTNRVCVLIQSVAGAAGFDRGGRLDRAAIARIAVPTLGGAVLGAWTASRVPPEILKPVLIATMALIAVTLVWRPAMLAPPEDTAPLGVFERPAALPGLVAIGFYGGFAQAGVGLFLIAFLGGVLRYDLVRANALKVVVIAAFTALSLAVFLWAGQVRWIPGLILSAGTVVGAQVAVRFAIARGAGPIRWIVFAMVLVSCGAALWR